MNIYLNGKKEECDDGTTVAALLAAREIKPEVVTVELNEAVLQRESYDGTVLKESDKVEFVYYMGGGSCQRSR